MSSNAAVKMEPDPIRACTICRDIQNFDLLIEDMEKRLNIKIDSKMNEVNQKLDQLLAVLDRALV